MKLKQVPVSLLSGALRLRFVYRDTDTILFILSFV